MPLFSVTTPSSETIRIRVGGVYVKNDQILLVRHAKDGKSYWLLPGGGVEVGETLHQALERETFEECGIRTRTEQLLFVSEAIAPAGDRHLVNMTFLGQRLEGEPHLRETDGRIVEVAYVEKNRLCAEFTLFPDFAVLLIQAWDKNFTLAPQYLGNLWRS